MPYLSIERRRCRRHRRSRTRCWRRSRGRGFRCLPKASNSNTPTGPFQTTVPAFRWSSGVLLRRCRADVENHVVGADGVDRLSPSPAHRRRTPGDDHVGRQWDVGAARLWRRLRSGFAVSIRSFSTSDLPTAMAHGSDEGVGVPPPTMRAGRPSTPADDSSSSLVPRPCCRRRWPAAGAPDVPAPSQAHRVRPSATDAGCFMRPDDAVRRRLRAVRGAEERPSRNVAQWRIAAKARASSSDPRRRFCSGSQRDSAGLARCRRHRGVLLPAASRPNGSDRRAATGASESASLHAPSGRRGARATITAAPFPAPAEMVGKAAAMRCSEVMRPPSIGTLEGLRGSALACRRGRGRSCAGWSWRRVRETDIVLSQPRRRGFNLGAVAAGGFGAVPARHRSGQLAVPAGPALPASRRCRCSRRRAFQRRGVRDVGFARQRSGGCTRRRAPASERRARQQHREFLAALPRQRRRRHACSASRAPRRRNACNAPSPCEMAAVDGGCRSRSMSMASTANARRGRPPPATVAALLLEAAVAGQPVQARRGWGDRAWPPRRSARGYGRRWPARACPGRPAARHRPRSCAGQVADAAASGYGSSGMRDGCEGSSVPPSA